MPSTMVKLKMNPRKRNTPLSTEQHELADFITAMQSQEESYTCVDYLSMTPWQNTMLTNKKGGSAIDEFCREQICEWTYRVVDYFRIDREVVSVSLNYLDRFLCTCSCDRSMFKLAATATLYMAVKVVHPQKLGDLGMLSDLSRGEFDMGDVAEMELHILSGLKWKLHPPTAAASTVLLLDYIKTDLSPSDLEDLYHNASFFSELSICDYFFVTLKPSTVALACVLNALEGMMCAADFYVLDQVFSLRIPTRQLAAARNRLWELYERSEECALHSDSQRGPRNKPVGVGGVMHKVGSATCMDTDHGSNLVASPVSVASDRCGKTSESIWPAAKHLQSNGSW